MNVFKSLNYQKKMKENKLTAAIIGATGLIGSHILLQLLGDQEFGEIRVLARRPFSANHNKLKVIKLDFADLRAFEDALFKVDIVFCAVGTTRGKTPDLNAYRKVDVDIPVNAARLSEKAGVKSFQLVSSVGADSNSRNFYLQMKGSVEDEVRKLNIPSINIFRPSLLLGKRNPPRLAEQISAVLMRPLHFLIPDQYKPIEAKQVAKAMIRASKERHPGFNILHYREMQ
jgi:uncharacterized protein YbjT (DUF2867 family)